MRRSKRLPPTDMPDWRDPDMQVIRPAMAPGDTAYKPYEFDPAWIQKYHQNTMVAPRVELIWKDDPSYHWAKKSKSNLK